MCVVSMVTDHTSWPKIPGPWYEPPYDLPKIDPIDYEDMVKKVIKYTEKNMSHNKFANWNLSQCKAFFDLLLKADEFDRLTNQPHCSDPNKTVILHDLSKRITEIGFDSTDQKERKECLKLVDKLDDFIAKLK